MLANVDHRTAVLKFSTERKPEDPTSKTIPSLTAPIEITESKHDGVRPNVMKLSIQKLKILKIASLQLRLRKKSSELCNPESLQSLNEQ